jgi:hypothetical protein
MNIDEAVAALKTNSLEIDCVEMKLTQEASTTPIVYEGKGYIRQNRDGVLNFKIYTAKVQNTNAAQDLMQQLSVKSGSLFADSDFFTLSVRDANGRTWTAERILPRPVWAYGACSFVEGGLRTIKTEHKRMDEKHSLSLRYFGIMELPINFGRTHFGNKKMGKQEISAANARIVVEEFPDETLFSATSTAPLDRSFHTRMDEASKFLTAKTVEWRVLERQDGKDFYTELTSGSPRSVVTRMDPPITSNTIGYWEQGWVLYVKYLEYVLRTTTHVYWSHCTSHLHNAREASANALDAWAAGLGVAVEGIAELIPLELREEEKQRHAALKKWLLEQINGQPDFVSYAGRIGGMLGGLSQLRARDRMFSLVETGHITKDYLDAWTALRNTNVHPKQIDPEQMDPNDLQEMLDRINMVTTLMYEIVFYLIGYSGPHTDYGQHGWPPREYPKAQEAAPDSKATGS